MIQARARQGKVSGLIPCRYRSTQKKCPASQRQRLSSCLASSADPVPPAAWPDSPAFRPLHFTAASANDGGTLSLRSDGQKLARPDKTGHAQRWQSAKTLVAALLARLEPSLHSGSRWSRSGERGKTGRDAPHIGQGNQ